MKPTLLTLSSLALLTWQLNAGAVCELNNVSKNIPGTVVSGYCSSNNDQISCNRSPGKRWTCRSFMGIYSSMELGKAIADSCSCQWTPPILKPEANDSFIPEGLSLDRLNDDNHDNDNDGTSKDILDYFTDEN